MMDLSFWIAFQAMRPIQIVLWLWLAHIYCVRKGWK